MKVVVLTVGKKHDKKIELAIIDYQKRLKKFCDFSWIYVPATNVDSESSALLRQLKDEDFVVLLDETGQQVDNTELADMIELAQNQSHKRMVFIIGGAFGVNYSVISKVNHVLSLGKLVFPHQLVRLMLTEQIYRSYSILSGSEYHHK